MRARFQLSVHIEEWATRTPFRITGRQIESFRIVVAVISDGVHEGRGEGHPIHYLGETAESVQRQIEARAGEIEAGLGQTELLTLLPRGAARCAVDCALWDLQAKLAGRRVWELLEITPRSLATAFTIGLEDTPQAMGERARAAAGYSILKIKVNADRPVERVAAIRAVRPDARLMVDANKAWTFQELVDIAPRLSRLGVRCPGRIFR